MPKIVILSRKVMLKTIVDSIEGKKLHKIYFQCQLNSFNNDSATLQVVAYAGLKKDKKWILGKRVILDEMAGEPSIFEFTTPVTFANNEIILISKKGIKKDTESDDSEIATTSIDLEKTKAKKEYSFPELFELAMNNKKLFEIAFFTLKGGVTKNPHIEYNVTLDVGGTTVSLLANPSPPAPPIDDVERLAG